MNQQSPTTLIEALKQAAESDKQYIFLDQKEPVELSYCDLLGQAKTVAGKLQAKGIAPGERVIIVLPTCPAFAVTFWGIVLAGAVPCVLPSPTLSRAPQTGIDKIEAVSQKIDGQLLITNDKEAAAWAEGVTALPIIAVEALEAEAPAPHRCVERNPADLAVIQATSGSTSAPKCVMLSHANILSNCSQIGKRTGIGKNDTVVCWLPMFHDMGLIGCFIYSLRWNVPLALMPSSKFIRRPFLFAKVVSDYRVTQSPSPNFAYGLLLSKITEGQLQSLDLSSWHSPICGAEPIDPLLLKTFMTRFQLAKLGKTAIAPAYGMAEVSVCATLSAPNEHLEFETLSDDELHQNGVAVPIPAGSDERSLNVCNCGRPVEGMSIEIRNRHRDPQPDGTVGRIWLSGPSIMMGYMGDPEKTAEILVDGWLDTGDIGYMRNGYLFVLGRDKELIIIRGHNYYPTDFERAAEQIDGIDPGRVVAFGVYNSAVFSEQLHLVCEVKKSQMSDELAERIKAHVATTTGIPPAHVALMPRGTIPRTTSGKLQRALLKKTYTENLADQL